MHHGCKLGPWSTMLQGGRNPLLHRATPVLDGSVALRHSSMCGYVAGMHLHRSGTYNLVFVEARRDTKWKRCLVVTEAC